ncbi:MAG TPA: serine--tRNA ligase, partial [Bacillus sp. (in: firmicutes)]|nr:serine--tRNA ligase [Bacillus sp. (in: firmicutes)]
RRRDLIIKVDEIRHRKNVLANLISTKRKMDSAALEEIKLMKEISNNLSNLEAEKYELDVKFKQLMMLLPNLLLPSVPSGYAESDNVFVRSSGTLRTMDFQPKDHVELSTSLDLVDFERAAKIAGSRFYFLKNDLVLLNQALIRMALDFLANNSYILMQPPYMIRKEAMEGAVMLGDFEQVIYKIEEEDLFMIATSEHAMASMHMNEILEGGRLPIKYAAISPCFRKEAGAHGKDMKGIFRVHQFEKVEQFVYSRPEESEKQHDILLATTENFYECLGIPTRTMLLCSGDTGKTSAKTFDLEAWMPGQNAYREIVSCSNCIDYQARGLHIRFRDKPNEETRLVHTLNSTLIATERCMVAILENYQTSRGTIEVPCVLRKYMNDCKEIEL